MNVGGGFGAESVAASDTKTGVSPCPFAIPRVHVTADMSLPWFEAHVSGFYRSLRKRLLGSDELEARVGD